jgi:D-alanyl-D-alanine carboxypeptidase
LAHVRQEIPMQPQTLVPIGSVSKLFTAVVVLQLVEEGKLDLDGPIGTWLPEIVVFADRTTVRQVLNHTSGIYDYLEDRRFFTQAYQNPGRAWMPAQLVALAEQVGPSFQPGAAGEWDYSSTNYVILGMLVEQVTGQPLADVMRQRIFEPVGLTHTFFAPDAAMEGQLAQGYVDDSDRVNLSMTFVYATGNIITTAEDLQRFGEALFMGDLLSPESRATMTTVVETGGAYAMPELQYGLGVMRARLNVGPTVDGAPRPEEASTVLGHIGGLAGFRSAVWWVPESGITIALGLNQANVDPNVLARDVLEVILTWQGR